MNKFPFREYIEKRLAIDYSFSPWIHPAIKEQIQDTFVARIHIILMKTFLLELHVAKVSGELKGKTSKARFESFISQLIAGKDRALFKEYPLLEQQLHIAKKLWEKNIVSIFRHLENDFEELKKHFGISNQLKKISLGSGDTHNGGKSVCALTFSNNRVLFHKPLNYKGAQVFSELLTEINSWNPPCDLKGPSYLLKEQYTWAKKVPHHSCSSEEEVQHYYFRVGMLLALADLLRTCDLHEENIIASGPYPILIDEETLFTPHSPSEEESGEVSRFFHLSSGLLSCILKCIDGKSISCSGLALSESRPFQIRDIAKNGTDQMYLTPKTIWKKGPNENVPRLNQRKMGPVTYIPQIEAGFEWLYTNALGKKESFLKKGGWFDRFSKSQFRYVFRPTQRYAELLAQAHEPSMQRAPDRYLLLLEELKKSLLSNPELYPTALAEQEALLQKDVPSFYFYPNQKAIFTHDKKVLNAFFLEPPINLVRESFENLSLHAIQQKKALIHLPLQTDHFSNISPVFNPNKCIELAVHLGNLIESARLQNHDHPEWINGQELLILPNSQVDCIDFNFYSGKGGLALYFSALYHCTKDEKWKKLALDVWQPLFQKDYFYNSLGGMSGIGSTIYSLQNSAKLLKAPQLLTLAKTFAESFSLQEIKDHQEWDMILGTAGLAITLWNLYLETKEISHKKKAQVALQSALKQFSHLKSVSTGLGHGSGGLLLALLKIAPNSFELKELIRWEQSQKRLSQKRSWCWGELGRALLDLSHFDRDLSFTRIPMKSERDHLCCGNSTLVYTLIEQQKRMGKSSLLQEEGTRLIKKDPHYVYSPKPYPELFNPSLMQGAAGIGYTLLRYTDPNLPNVLLLD